MAIRESHILKDAVKIAEIAVNSVGTEELVDGAATTPKIADAPNGATTAKINDGAVTTPKLADAPNGVDTGKINDGAVTKAKLKATSIQAGSASVSFPFAAAGVENVNVTITFPTAFAAAPTTVIITCSVADINVAVTGITASDFTVTARDSEGTDYTAAVSATIKWIAIE